MKKVGKKEFGFYSEVLHKIVPELQVFVPKFHGTEVKDGNNYIVIEDLTHTFKKPCILDIKMGTSSVGEDATPEKREAMSKKDKATTTCTLGLRITAMKVYQLDQEKYLSRDKDWGKNVTDSNFKDSLATFFHNGKDTRYELIAKYVEKLKPIQEWINSQLKVRIYSSSLLFIYDGDPSNNDIELKMIDFAHVHEVKDNGKDEGYILGMKNLLESLAQIQ